jgi:hypothetical protein
VDQRDAADGHDISHITELNEAFTAAGLPLIALWG